MKENLLEYIRCPECGSSFMLESSERENGEVKTGALLCGGCAKRYSIRGFIPRILESGGDELVERTAKNFGAQWNRYTTVYDIYREQFLEWINPLTEADFKDKIVLDAGCGMGRWLSQAAQFGAKEAIGVDLSNAVDAAYQLVKDQPNAHVIQADIMKLPFANPFDLFYSIGVLHHIPVPKAGFMSAYRTLKPGARAHTWVYGLENNEWIVKWVNPIREKVTSRLSDRSLAAVAFLITLFLHPAIKIFYYTAGKLGISPLKKILPYFSYLYWLSCRSFGHTQHVVHDHLNPPIAFYIPKEEFKSWFEEAGAEDIQILPRNNNSWIGVARVKGKE